MKATAMARFIGAATLLAAVPLGCSSQSQTGSPGASGGSGGGAADGSAAGSGGAGAGGSGTGGSLGGAGGQLGGAGGGSGGSGGPDGGAVGCASYPVLPGAVRSPLYTLTVNGTSMFVEKMTKFSPE